MTVNTTPRYPGRRARPLPASCLWALPCLVWALAAAAGEAPPAAPPPVPEDGALTLKSKVATVTVYADRARVTRSCEVELKGDLQRVAFRGLPGWIDEGSVRVALVPPEAGAVLEVQVRKAYLAQAGTEEVRKAEAAVQELSDQLEGLSDEAKVLEAQERQIEAIRAFSLEKLPRDAVVREIKVASYGEAVDFVADSLRKTAKARRELAVKRRQIEPEFTVRQRVLADLRARAQLEQRTILLSLKGQAPRSATLQLTYLLPGASWEPAHELRAVNGAKSVTLASFAAVTQTTGEDWEEAQLTLSTQRVADVMRVPELEELLLGAGRVAARLSKRGQDSYQQAYLNWSLNRKSYNPSQNKGKQLSQEEYNDNDAQLLAAQQRAQGLFERLQQRGTTAHFQVKGSQSVSTDGRPLRVALGSVDLAAQPRVVAAPEASLNAARTVEVVNGADRPLLPGQVALYVDGSFLGGTELDFVGPGESFTMFLGVVDSLKLSRELDRKSSSLVRSGNRTRMQLSYLVAVENLSEQQQTVLLSDRIPIADSDEIRVRNVKVSPEVLPDNKGLLRWEARLSPKERRVFQVEYQVEYPADLALRMPQGGPQRAAAEQSEKKEPQGSSPSQSGQQDAPQEQQKSLQRQLLDLEKTF